jgi:hypothetical protein
MRGENESSTGLPAATWGRVRTRSTVFFSRLPSSRPDTGRSPDSRTSIGPKSGALMTAGSAKVPSSPQEPGRTVAGVVRGSNGKMTSAASHRFFTACQRRSSLPSRVRISQLTSAPSASRRKRVVSRSRRRSMSFPAVHSFAALIFRPMPAPSRRRLIWAFCPPSVSQLRKTTSGREASVSTPTRGGPAEASAAGLPVAPPAAVNKAALGGRNATMSHRPTRVKDARAAVFISAPCADSVFQHSTRQFPGSSGPIAPVLTERLSAYINIL